MTKAELVSFIAEKSTISKKAAGAALTCFVKAVHESLSAEGKLRVDGLGTFVVSDRKARTGFNPQTRAKIQIPASKVPSFRAAKALKDAVKETMKKPAKKGK